MRAARGAVPWSVGLRISRAIRLPSVVVIERDSTRVSLMLSGSTLDQPAHTKATLTPASPIQKPHRSIVKVEMVKATPVRS